MRKICFFIGHRETDESIYPALRTAVQRHIVEYGVTEFIVGQYGGFDRLAARCVVELKAIYSQIRLYILCPYHPTEREPDLPEGVDGTYYPDGMERVPKRMAIVQANRRMVKQSDYLIACVWHPGSNAREILLYAQKRETAGKMHITNIGNNKNSSFSTFPWEKEEL